MFIKRKSDRVSDGIFVDDNFINELTNEKINEINERLNSDFTKEFENKTNSIISGIDSILNILGYKQNSK